MSAYHAGNAGIQGARPEDQTPFYTLQGLAAEFGISPRTINKYREWRIIPAALGTHPNGFNYDHTHYTALAEIRAQRESYVPLRERAHQARRPHCVTRNPQDTA